MTRGETVGLLEVLPEHDCFMSTFAEQVLPVSGPQVHVHVAGGTCNPSFPSTPTAA